MIATNATGITIIVASVILIAILIVLWARRGGIGWALPIAAVLFIEALSTALLVNNESIPTWQYITFGISIAFGIVMFFVVWPRWIEIILGAIFPIVAAIIVCFTVHFDEVKVWEWVQSGWKLLDAIPLWMKIVIAVVLVLSILLSLVKRTAGWPRSIAWTILGVLLIMSLSLLISVGKTPIPSDTSETVSPTPTPVQDISALKQFSIASVRLALEKNGFVFNKDFVLEEDVNPSLDKSTAGEGSFSGGAKSIAEVLAFLQSGTKEANASLDEYIRQTGATKEEVLNPDRWVVGQFLTKFVLKGNMHYQNGVAVSSTNPRNGIKGELMFFFVYSNTSVSVDTPPVVVPQRQACGNPQRKLPEKDPAAQGNAPEGGGKNEDPGPGDYIAPSDMITPAATTRVDPTQPTETGLAPSASPTPAPSAGVSPTPSPAPETGANPTGTETANPGGDPGYPTGGGW